MDYHNLQLGQLFLVINFKLLSLAIIDNWFPSKKGKLILMGNLFIYLLLGYFSTTSNCGNIVGDLYSGLLV